MLYLGYHLSSAGGFEPMGREAIRAGANTFAFFTRSPRGGKAKAIDPEEVFREGTEKGKGAGRRVTVPLLFVRSGPGTEYPIVDSLKRGEQVSGDLTAETVWLKIGDRRWIAVRYQGEDFCELTA